MRPSDLVGVSKAEFDAVLTANPLATPDGFRLVGGTAQTRYHLDRPTGRVEAARASRDGFGPQYEVAADLLPAQEPS